MHDTSNFTYFNSVSDCVIITDNCFKIIWFNKKMENIICEFNCEVFNGNLSDYLIGINLETLTIGKKYSGLISVSGSFIPVQLVHAGLIDHEYNLFLFNLRDAEDYIDHLEVNIQRLKALVLSLNIALLLEDEDRNILLTNDLFCSLFKIPASPLELIGNNCSDSAEQSKNLFKYPDRFVESIQVILDQKVLVENEILLMSDGRILERDYIPLFIDHVYKGHLWLYKDVTSRDQLSRKIRENDEKYQRMLENMELGLLEVNIDETIVNVYDGFCRMTGYSQEELMGRNARDLLLFDDKKDSFNKEASKRNNGQSSVYEIQVRKKDGTPIWVLISGTPVFNPDGEVAGSVGIHYDITKQKKLQEELIAAKHRAEQAMDAEKSFLANMSHEIRNPLNVLVGVSNLLYDTKLSKPQKEYVDAIKYSGELLLDLVSDILDINKINSGEMNPELNPVDLHKELAAIIKTFQFRIGSRDLKIELETPSELKWSLLTDRTFINQIMMNLIGNAVKFTEHGIIRTSLLVDYEDENTLTIRIVVQDTGIGIPFENQSEIFKAFKQVNNEVKLKYGGSGLGLSITRHLVEKLGGEIFVSSKLNEGTTFSVVLPLIKDKPLCTKVNNIVCADNKPLIKGRVLVAEDFVLNQKYISGLLSKHNLSFTLCNNGEEALELLEKEHYDLILMDIRMPKMDGYEAAIRIRQMQNTNASIPILALTASALLDEREKALQAGMNDHLTKPFTEDQLIQNIGRLLNKPTSNGSLTHSSIGFFDRFPDVFDKDLLHTYYGDNEEFFITIASSFYEQAVEVIYDLKYLIVSKNHVKIASLLHKIKPNLSLVGLSHLYDQISKIEEYILSPEFEFNVWFEAEMNNLLVELELVLPVLLSITTPIHQ